MLFRSGYNDDNGDNWRFSFNQKITGYSATRNQSGAWVSRIGGDGVETTYHYDQALGAYVSTDGDGAHDTIRYVSGGGEETWTWREGSTGLTEYYDAGNVLRGFELEGQEGRVRITDYHAGNVRRLEDASGQLIHIDYNGAGNADRIRVVKDGVTYTTTRYEYDAQNRLEKVIVDLTPYDTTDNVGETNTYITTYTYHGDSKRVATVTQSDQTTIHIQYSQADGYHYYVSRIQYGDGDEAVITKYDYDLASKKTTVTQVINNESETGYETDYHYSDSGELTLKISPANESGVRVATAYQYDADGNLETVMQGDQQIDYRYNSNGTLREKQDQLGNTVRYTYHPTTNFLQTETTFLLPDADGIDSAVKQPADPATTRYIYNDQQQLAGIIDAEGGVTVYRYNNVGQRRSELRFTEATYDTSALNESQVPTLAQFDAWVLTNQPTDIQRIDYTYDFRGQLETETTYAEMQNDNGVVATATTRHFIYDAAGNLIKTVGALGSAPAESDVLNPLSVDHNPSNYETHYVYDGLNRLISTTDTTGVTTSNVYDSANNTISTTNAQGLRTTSTFNSAGLLLSVEQLDATNNANSVSLGQTQYVYDDAGRLIQEIDPTGVVTRNLYDPLGRLVGKIDGEGYLTEQIFDANDQVIETIRHATQLTNIPAEPSLSSIRPSTNNNDRHSYNRYDNAGRLIATLDAEGYVEQLFYDGQSNLVETVTRAKKHSFAEFNVFNITASSDDRSFKNIFDLNGRKVATIDPDGYVTEFQYDHAGLLTNQTAYRNPVGLMPLSGDGTSYISEDFMALDEVKANQSTGSNQLNSKVTLLDNGSIVVVWRSEHSGNSDIYARVYDARGIAITDEFIVNSYVTGAQMYPDVTAIDNGFVINWASGEDGDNYSLHTAVYDSDGNQLRGPSLVNTSTQGNQSASSIIRHSDGVYTVIWHSSHSGRFGIYGQKYSAQGIFAHDESIPSPPTY